MLSLNGHAHVSGQGTGTGGLLRLALPAAKPQPERLPVVLKFKVGLFGFFLCHPGWMQILGINGREPGFLLKKFYLCFFSSRKMEFQLLGFLIGILILSYIPLFSHLKSNLIIVADAL